MVAFCVIDDCVSLVLHRCLIFTQQTVNMSKFCQVKIFCLSLNQARVCFLELLLTATLVCGVCCASARHTLKGTVHQYRIFK